MSRSSCVFFFLAAATVIVANGSAQAKENSENISIVTTDGVKLRGTFYPADEDCLATVIMLHPIGEGKSMKVPEWKSLAESLQKSGYSVLMFNFRGHGDSTEIVQPKDFWSKMPNVANIKTQNKLGYLIQKTHSA
jgi:alpha-beta hydrolase superfamily lysophospholipase